MDRACENCRFCIYAHSRRGKEERYCERYSKWIGDTLLCSEWEMVSVPKPQTHGDSVRAMTDEELAETYAGGCPNGDRLNCGKYYLYGGRDCFNCWLDWLKSPVNLEAGK